MSSREINSAGEKLLSEFLHESLAIPRAIRSRDYIALAGAAQIASKPVDGQMALVNSARFCGLRSAITMFFLHGYGILDQVELTNRANSIIEKRSS